MSPVSDPPGTNAAPPRWSAPARALAAVVSLAVLAAVLSPGLQNWREEPRDSFPLSYYPMFNRSRGQSARVTYLVAVDEQGQRHRLHHAFVGTGGLNQVRKQINRLVQLGQTEKLCQLVGGNIARLKGEPFARLVELQVVTGWYDLHAYFSGNKTPLSEHLHAAYLIPRRPADDSAATGGHGEPLR